MPRKNDAEQLPFMVNQHRERLRDWDHSVTAEEADIQSLIFDNLFDDGEKAELAVLYVALQDQRLSDNRQYHNNRAEFDRRQAAYSLEAIERADKMFRKQKEE